MSDHLHSMRQADCAAPYGKYVGYLMHGETSEHRYLASIWQKELERLGFRGWGLQLARWPEAHKAYMLLCADRGFTPELELDCDIKEKTT